MIYELRVYHCVPGRLPDLLKRFDTITLKLWDKHGIKQAGFWTVLVGESNQDLYYLLKWETLAEREQKFGAFGADLVDAEDAFSPHDAATAGATSPRVTAVVHWTKHPCSDKRPRCGGATVGDVLKT